MIRPVLIVFAVGFAGQALAQGKSIQIPQQSPKERPLPLRTPSKGAESCAAFGAGFVKVDGSGTCVRIGGAISAGGSVSSR